VPIRRNGKANEEGVMRGFFEGTANAGRLGCTKCRGRAEIRWRWGRARGDFEGRTLGQEPLGAKKTKKRKGVWEEKVA